MDRIENDANNSYFTELLPSNDKGIHTGLHYSGLQKLAGVHRQTDTQTGI
jgi:hypothetical protein